MTPQQTASLIAAALTFTAIAVVVGITIEASLPRRRPTGPRDIARGIGRGLVIAAGSCLAVALAFAVLYGSATIASHITGVPREQIIGNP